MTSKEYSLSVPVTEEGKGKLSPQAGIGARACLDHLNEIHDMLTLALDATAQQTHFSPSQIEARVYMNVALRKTLSLIGGAA